jgi:hypothetical protein
MRVPVRGISLALGLWASIVFVMLWIGGIAGALIGGTLFADAWTTLGGLPVAVQVGVWVALLPVCVALWAAQAGVPVAVQVLVLFGLALWTWAAWGSLARTMRALRAGRAQEPPSIGDHGPEAER